MSDRLHWQVYEDTLLWEGLGTPLWEADPGGGLPPEIGAIGYFACVLVNCRLLFNMLTHSRADGMFKVSKMLDVAQILQQPPGSTAFLEPRVKMYPYGIHRVHTRVSTEKGERILPFVR
jgi:hypothetical protein